MYFLYHFSILSFIYSFKAHIKQSEYSIMITFTILFFSKFKFIFLTTKLHSFFAFTMASTAF